MLCGYAGIQLLFFLRGITFACSSAGRCFLGSFSFPKKNKKQKNRLSCNFLTGQCVSSDDKDKKCSNTVMYELARVIILITVGIHLYDQTTKRFSKLVFLIFM